MLDVQILTAKATIGDPVKNTHGVNLGTISNVLVDKERASVDFAVIISTENNKEIAVPFDELELQGEEGYFLLDLDKDHFNNPPGVVSYNGKSYLSHKK